MKPILSVIIPTYNRPDLLQSCLNSFILSTYGPIRELIDYIIVNNGPKENEQAVPEGMRIIHAGQNLGWEGGLKLGLEHTDAPFVLFANDDIRIITGQKNWFWQMMATFNNPAVGAVGPSSNYVMGHQNIMVDALDNQLEVTYLIGFFMLLRRKALEEVGGVDDTLPGGDDIDLSIRLRNANWKLVARRDVFVYHHGSATGAAVHGGYWNSPEMTEQTQFALIRKHGFRTVFDTLYCHWNRLAGYSPTDFADEDVEGDFCRKWADGEKILELGCGGRKTIPNATGIDLHGLGERVPFVTAAHQICEADIIADVSTGLPVDSGSQDTLIARHIIEHCQDPLGTLCTWNKALRIGGRLIIAAPNNGLGNTMTMNPQHVVSFVPESLERLGRAAGFEPLEIISNLNGISFGIAFSKISDPLVDMPAPRATKFPLAAELAEAVPA